MHDILCKIYLVKEAPNPNEWTLHALTKNINKKQLKKIWRLVCFTFFFKLEKKIWEKERI